MPYYPVVHYIDPGTFFVLLIALIVFLCWRRAKRRKVRKYGDSLLGAVEDIECAITALAVKFGYQISARTTITTASISSRTAEAFIQCEGVRIQVIIDSTILPPAEGKVVAEYPLQHEKTFWIIASALSPSASASSSDEDDDDGENEKPVKILLTVSKNDTTFGDFGKTVQAEVTYPDGSKNAWSKDLEDSSRMEANITIGG